MRKIVAIFLVLLLTTAMLGACSFKTIDEEEGEGATPTQAQPDTQPTSSVMSTQEENEIAEKMAMVIYFADNEATMLVAEKRFVPKKEIEDMEMATQMAMQELFKGPISGNLTLPFPKDVPMPAVNIENNVAIVDLAQAFVEEHPGGSAGETLTVYSMVNTLTAFQGIDMVKFTLEGQEITAFKGHLDFSEPFTMNTELMQQEDLK